MFYDIMWIGIFEGLNGLNFLMPAAKYMMIFYESSLDWNDCGVFNCFWALNSYVGQINLDVEMYPDIAKAAALGVNFLLYLLFQWVDDWMQGKTPY